MMIMNLEKPIIKKQNNLIVRSKWEKHFKSNKFCMYLRFLRFLPECLNLAPINKLPCKFSRNGNSDKTQNFNTFCTLCIMYISSVRLSDQLLNNCQWYNDFILLRLL